MPTNHPIHPVFDQPTAPALRALGQNLANEHAERFGETPDAVLVTVKHKGVAYTVDVNQDLAYVIDELEHLISDANPRMAYERTLDLADTLGQRALRMDPR